MAPEERGGLVCDAWTVQCPRGQRVARDFAFLLRSSWRVPAWPRRRGAVASVSDEASSLRDKAAVRGETFPVTRTVCTGEVEARAIGALRRCAPTTPEQPTGTGGCPAADRELGLGSPGAGDAAFLRQLRRGRSAGRARGGDRWAAGRASAVGGGEAGRGGVALQGHAATSCTPHIESRDRLCGRRRRLLTTRSTIARSWTR